MLRHQQTLPRNKAAAAKYARFLNFAPHRLEVLH
jgi:hypothetical protein